MRLVSLFGLVAILPALVNASPSAAAISVPLCTGDGAFRSISLPIVPRVPGSDDSPCSAKGCHSGNARKRLIGEFDPSQ